MSTKTSIKRIALVAVSALGLGMFSAVSPARALTASFATDATSYTVVTSSDAEYGLIRITTTDDAGLASPLGTGESITATVVAWPSTETTSAPNDFVFGAWTRIYSATAANASAGGTWASAAVGAETNGKRGSYNLTPQTPSGDSTAGNTAIAARQNTYYLGVALDQNKKALDKGEYTLRLRMTDSSGFITDKTVKIKFVSSAADTGAKITVTATGSFRNGETVTLGANNRLTASLTDANGGKIQVGKTDSNIVNTGSRGNAGIGLPVLRAAIWGGSTAAVLDDTPEFFVSDTGTSGSDHYSSTSDSSTAFAAYGNGTYGIIQYNNHTVSADQTTVSPYLRVTYGSVAATAALTIYNSTTGTAGTPVITAANLGATSAVTTSAQVTAGTASWLVPLTTKEVTYTISGATAGRAYSYTVTWANVATGDQTPVSATPTLVYADSSGVVTFKINNANPIDGAKATIAVGGFPTAPTNQIVGWQKSTAKTISVTLNGAYVALKSTNKFEATVTDAFGAPVAGVVLQPSLSSTSSNYSATATYASVVTDAAGKASFSLTDAKAVAAGTDKVTFTDLAGNATAGSSTITYAATAPSVTTMTPYYSVSASTADEAAEITTGVPSTGIYADTAGTKFKVVISKNTGRAVTVADTTVSSSVASGDQLAIKIVAGVAGAAINAKASTGAYIVSSAGFASSSVDKYSDADGNAFFVVGTNATGANTITFTSGTATTSVAFWSTSVAASARFVTLTKGDNGAVVAKVTDRYGNGISGVSVQIGTDAGTLGNGQMTTVYTTDSNGSVSVLPVGATGDTANITALLSTTGDDTTSAAGYVGTTAVDSSLAAGTRSVTLAVTLNSSASDAATAAQDAANDAVEAANAATDAANAAAEAADAATAAAQDAQAAVADLAAQVATLISGIKAQITRLTNLVIKIQKKVNA